MRISRIQIQNFRNFNNIDVEVGNHLVIVGENRIGKSNFVHALRLILDPSLPDSARQLRIEDLWDGIGEQLTNEHRILIAVELTDFENDEYQFSILAEHLVQVNPMISRLTYVWQPLAGLQGFPKKEADFEWFIYGGDKPENRIGYEVRRRLPLDLMPALRDAESDLARWTRSPLRPLLDQAAGNIQRDKLDKLAKGVDKATERISNIEQVKSVSDSINMKLIEMMGSRQALETLLRFSPTDPDKFIRSLRLYIDGGKRGISDASLGSANLLYLVLQTLEYEQLTKSGNREHTFLAIEEPEAHLHPHLQRLVFRSYLRPRIGKEEQPTKTTIILTTHSPNIVSVAPLRSLVFFRPDKSGKATQAISTSNLQMDSNEIADLERYIDVTRGELLFSKGVILVEGEAEKLLVPVLAKKIGFDLDEYGVTVGAVGGTDFAPYLKLFGPNGLNVPFSALTDRDIKAERDYGLRRLRKCISILQKKNVETMKDNQIITTAETLGIFINKSTLEIELFECGYQKIFQAAMLELSHNTLAKQRIKDWTTGKKAINHKILIRDIESIGKGRFAQRLATIIAVNKKRNCPKYIAKGIKHVIRQCK